MSILIKGMEMPTSCGDCRFCGGIADTDCGPCAWCDVDGKARVADTRQDCHLVPVPPHGRWNNIIQGIIPSGQCSNCGAWDKVTRFCPNCGSQMEGAT